MYILLQAVEENIWFKVTQPQGGPVQKPRTKYSPVLLNLRSAVIYFRVLPRLL